MIHIKKNFNYCLDTYVIRDPKCFGHSIASGENLIKKINITKKAGFSAIELWHTDIIKYIECGNCVYKLKEQIQSLGMVVPSYKVMESWENIDVLKYASLLGAKSCVVKLLKDEYTGPCPSLNKIIEKYKNILDIGDKLNIKPSLEFMALAKYFNNINDACDVLEKIDHPKKSIVLDTWHLWRNDSCTFKNCPFDRIKPEWISVVHFTDASREIPREKQKDNSRRMPGEGVLDLSYFCKKLIDINFHGWLSLNVYDTKLWEEDSLKVATRGLYSMKRIAENSDSLLDSKKWSYCQKKRCDELWAKKYFSHLDPRIDKSNRRELLLPLIKEHINNKKVLDFKCGFSPLADFVSVGFDGFEGCIKYLKENFPKSSWYCQSDLIFCNWFDQKIDILMHLGLGDSITEIESHLKLRERCRPSTVILEAAADANGNVDESKPGNCLNWEKLKFGLNGETFLINTNMKERSKRIIFIGKNVI